MLLLSIISVAVLVVISSILNGVAFQYLWGLFIVPLFGLPEIGVCNAIGIGIVVSMLTYREQHEPRDKKEKSALNVVIIVIGMPIFAMLYGYIVSLFM